MPGVGVVVVVIGAGEAADEMPTGSIRRKKTNQIRKADRFMPVLPERYIE
jgi:hypothetical protein